ncbi:MAG: cystathionine beta-synthase, partial [Patiriisocius sp.]
DQSSALTARELATTEGLFVGYTSGAAMQGLKQLNQEGVFDSTSNIVVVFPDHGSRYMSKIYSENWMQDQGFLDSHQQSKAPSSQLK